MVPNRLLLGSIVVVTLLAGILAVYFLLIEDSDSGTDQLTYSNSEHGYEIDYPPDWELVTYPTGGECSDFCTQSIELRHPDAGEVYVIVNFQGGLCENVRDLQYTDIEVAGYPGQEFHCPGFTIKSFGEGGSLSRLFPDVNDRQNYLVYGQAHGDLTIVESIVRSFRFTDR
jgi:hypothetical protein